MRKISLYLPTYLLLPLHSFSTDLRFHLVSLFFCLEKLLLIFLSLPASYEFLVPPLFVVCEGL